MNVEQFRDVVIERVLRSIGLYSEWAVNLLLGTALQESRLQYLVQLGGGPALGVYQMEPATHDDIWQNWLRHRPEFVDRVRKYAYVSNDLAVQPKAQQLTYDLAYATTMTRLHYYRARFEIPQPADIAAQARIWKDVYNTAGGHGTVEQYLATWDDLT